MMECLLEPVAITGHCLFFPPALERQQPVATLMTSLKVDDDDRPTMARHGGQKSR